MPHHDIDDMDLGEDVDVRMPFTVPKPQPETAVRKIAGAVSSVAPMLSHEAGCGFLYIEKKPARVYQYHAQPSPGDLRRIERGRLRVLGFQNGFVEFQADGTTVPIEVYGECESASSKRQSTSSSTNGATSRVGPKFRKRRESTVPTSPASSGGSDKADASPATRG